MANRDIRLQGIPKRFDGKRWETEDRPLVRLGDVGRWSMVRRADISNSCPFVISRKEWDKLQAQGMPREATRRECGSGASAPASSVANGDAPQVHNQGGDA